MKVWIKGWRNSQSPVPWLPNRSGSPTDGARPWRRRVGSRRHVCSCGVGGSDSNSGGGSVLPFPFPWGAPLFPLFPCKTTQDVASYNKSLVHFAKGCSDFDFLPTNRFSLEPLKVKLLAGETEFSWEGEP